MIVILEENGRFYFENKQKWDFPRRYSGKKHVLTIGAAVILELLMFLYPVFYFQQPDWQRLYWTFNFMKTKKSNGQSR